MDIGDQIAITGVGESEYSDGGGNNAEDLIVEASVAAIEDAGLRPRDVNGVVVEGEMMPETMPPAELASNLGIDRTYSAQSLPVGSGIGASPLLAAQAIRDGLAEHVLCYFGVDWASTIESAGAYEGGPYSYHTSNRYKANFEIPFGWVTQPVYLAAHARRHMHEFGTTHEHLAEVAMQTRQNAMETTTAQKREPMSRTDYFESPIIADPFRIADCCMISDGAGAFVLSSADAAHVGPNPPVSVEGVGTGYDRTSDSEYMTQNRDYTSLPSVESGPAAFEMAGVTPQDVDFAELYDCFTITTIMQLEDLGFCEKGQGGQFVQERGITVANGDLPVNTHGGLLSQVYTLGVSHVVEAVRQLRGEADNQVTDAQTGVVALWGESTHSTLVLGGDR